MTTHRLRALLVLTALLLMATAERAQAIIWHSPSGYTWTVTAICPDGIEVVNHYTPSSTPDEAAQWGEVQGYYAFTAHAIDSAPETPTAIALPPVGTDAVTLGFRLGQGRVPLALRSTPLQWTDDNLGTSGLSYLHGRARLAWDSGTANMPLGTSVAVQWDGDGSRFFTGQVTQCGAKSNGGPEGSQTRYLHLPVVQR